MSALVPSRSRDEHGLEGLRARVSELETLLRERGAEIVRLKVALAEFKARYQQQVGRLYEELDELEAAIARAELGEIEKRLDEEAAAPRGADAPGPLDAQPRYTSDNVRKLFRDVAKAIHPDLADDEETRRRRHALMIEANRAYALGDEERLRRILQSWEISRDAAAGSDAETRLRLAHRIVELEEQLALAAGDLDALTDSPMWKLKSMVDEAAAQGKDLIRDMVTRLRVDILVARNRLHAIEWTPDT